MLAKHELPISEAVTIGRGFAFKSSSYSDSGVNVLRVTDIEENGEINTEKMKKVPLSFLETYSKYKLDYGDILLVMVGATVGKLGFYKTHGERALLNQNMWKLRTADENVLSQEYLAYAIRPVITSYLSQQQGSAREFLTQKTFGRLSISVPPIEEQRRIAGILSTWEKTINAYDRLIALKEMQAKQVVEDLVTGNVRLPAFSEYEWDETEISELIKESRLPGTNGLVAKKITVKLYGLGAHEKSESRPGSSATKYYQRKSGQFIYSKLDFLNGAFAIIPDKLDGFESTLDLPAFDFTEKVNPLWFLSFVGRESFYTTVGLMFAKGGRKARRVSPSSLLSVKIKLPSLDEQAAISKIIKTSGDKIAALKKKKLLLEEQKKGLMQQLLA